MIYPGSTRAELAQALGLLASNMQSGVMVARAVGLMLILGAIYTGINSWRALYC